MNELELVKDADALRRSVLVLRERAKKPNSIFLGVMCRLLTDQADKIELELRKGEGC